MARGKTQSKRKKLRNMAKTPELSQKALTMSSSCTWGDVEFDHLKVDIQRDVNVREMIPEKFFSFEKLESYAECMRVLILISDR